MFERSVGKKPVPIIASSRTSTGGSTGVKPCCGQRGRARSGRARARAAPCRRRGSRSASRRAARRAPCSKRPTSVCSRGSVERRRLADAAELDRVLLRVAVRRRRVRRVRHAAASARVALGLGRRELLLGGRSSSLTCRSSSSCSGVGLPFSFVAAAQLVDARHERAPALVGGEQRVERLGGALAARARRASASGSARAALRSIMARESRVAPRSPWRRPPRGPGQTQSARSSSSGCAFSTAIP